MPVLPTGKSVNPRESRARRGKQMLTKLNQQFETEVETEKPGRLEIDKITEEKMAELLGTTQRALQTRRQRGQIPQGVWNKIGSRIIYSKWRYEQWLESLWVCPLELKYEEMPSESASPGMASVTGKRLPIPRRRKGSNQPVVYVIK